MLRDFIVEKALKFARPALETYAVEEDRMDILEWLEKTNPSKPVAIEAFTTAISQGKYKFVEYMLVRNPDLANSRLYTPSLNFDDHSEPVLHAACMNDTVDNPEPIVRLLLEHKANVNRRNNVGATALASSLDDYSYHPKATRAVIKCLVEFKANINLPSFKGNTPLFITIKDKDEVAFCDLLSQGALLNANAKFSETYILKDERPLLKSKDHTDFILKCFQKLLIQKDPLFIPTVLWELIAKYAVPTATEWFKMYQCVTHEPKPAYKNNTY